GRCKQKRENSGWRSASAPLK
ncbi:hypothetical protein pipiens_000086, partial [Culex pipiens pipiens]